MGKKRKIPVSDKSQTLQKVQKEGSETAISLPCSSNRPQTQHGPMYTIMSNVQLGETHHKKYIKEMQQLYKKMDHDAFMFTFIKMLKNVMQSDESNEYATITLLFCSKYVASYDGESELTHPILSDTFNWLLKTTSINPHIRFRICQFVNYCLNALGQEAALDDTICDNIMRYMINCLRDVSQCVRVQAIYALQRLQNPDNPDDIIVKSYKFHLSSDPSSRVRQAVLSAIGRNYNTIPYILERLWDTDEKTRRHTYVNMSSYPVKAYKVSERITFLEQGLNDRSEIVRKVVTNVMLPQWLQAYNKNYIAFVAGLKIDANEIEIERFRKVAKMTLHEIFKHEKIEDLVECLPLQLEPEIEFTKCVLENELNIETSFYWLCLIEYLIQKNSDYIDEIIPELTTFCSYVIRYYESQKIDEEDKWKKMEYQYILLTLIEILLTFDLGDEIGRDNLKQLIVKLLINYELHHKCVEMIVKCSENLITNQEDRLNFFIDIIKEITDANMFKNSDIFINRELLDEYLEKNPDKSLKLKLSALKVKILDLEEQETNYVEKKDYVQAQKIADSKETCIEQYRLLVQSIMNQSNASGEQSDQANLTIFHRPKKITTEEIIKCLQISFYMVNSIKVKSLTPNVCGLYKEFIRRHIESNQIAIRDWALKCGTAYSMLYEQLAKDVYSELYSQFFKNQNIAIWKTAIYCIFELIDRYGFVTFESEDKQNKSKRPGRMLYNTMEFLDMEEDESGNMVDFVFMVSHILDTCNQETITEACIVGLCRLVLHGHIITDTIVPKLLLKYFNPTTEPAINQLLGVFFENLVQRKKQEYLHTCLLQTVSIILVAPYDSPLHEIKPDTILKFVIDSTRPQFCIVGSNIHNQIALSFLNEIQNNIANKELAKLLSKELISLEINMEDSSFISDLKSCCIKLLQCELDSKVSKSILNFKAILDGTYRASTRPKNIERNSEDEENELSDDEDNQSQDKTKTNKSQTSVQSNKNSEIVESVSETLSTIIEENQEKESELDKTPTMFGRDNSPNIRYLRKSMNSRTSSTSIPLKKIRIEAKMQSDKKGIEEVSNYENEEETTLTSGTIEQDISAINKSQTTFINELETAPQQSNINGINNNKRLESTNNEFTVHNIETPKSSPMKTPLIRKTHSLTNGEKSQNSEALKETLLQTRSLRKNRVLASRNEINLTKKVNKSNSENKEMHNNNGSASISNESSLNNNQSENNTKRSSPRLLRTRNINSVDSAFRNSIQKSAEKSRDSDLSFDNETIQKKKTVTQSAKKAMSTPTRKVLNKPSTSEKSIRNRSEWIETPIHDDVEIIPSSPVLTRSSRKRSQKITTEETSSKIILTRNKRVLNPSLSPVIANENTVSPKFNKKKKLSNDVSENANILLLQNSENSSSAKTSKQNIQSEKSKITNKNQSEKYKTTSKKTEQQEIGINILNGSYKTRSARVKLQLDNSIATRRRRTEENNSIGTQSISNLEKSKKSNQNISETKALTKNGVKKPSKIPIKSIENKNTNSHKKITNKIAKDTVVKDKNPVKQSKLAPSKILSTRVAKDAPKLAKDSDYPQKRNNQSKLPQKVYTVKRIKK